MHTRPPSAAARSSQPSSLSRCSSCSGPPAQLTDYSHTPAAPARPATYPLPAIGPVLPGPSESTAHWSALDLPGSVQSPASSSTVDTPGSTATPPVLACPSPLLNRSSRHPAAPAFQSATASGCPRSAASTGPARVPSPAHPRTRSPAPSKCSPPGLPCTATAAGTPSL